MKSRTEVDPTTLDRPTSPRESETFFRKCEGVRFLRAELQTALTSRLLGHIRVDFTHETMMINILQILVRFWKSTWIFAWYPSSKEIIHPVYQKLQNCVQFIPVMLQQSNSKRKVVYRSRVADLGCRRAVADCSASAVVGILTGREQSVEWSNCPSTTGITL